MGLRLQLDTGGAPVEGAAPAQAAVHTLRDPGEAARVLAELRNAEPLAALSDLRGWIEELQAGANDDPVVRSEILAVIQESAEPHVAAVLAQFVERPSGDAKARESAWREVTQWLAASSEALRACASDVLDRLAAAPSLAPAAAAATARALRAARLRLKAFLLRYLATPAELWRDAYALHERAESADCAGVEVRVHDSQRAPTTVTQELLRLLMLRSGSPDMLAPAQIEVADWAVEHIGSGFVLRPRGSADNVFMFDPSSDAPPKRAIADEPSAAANRYFGAGAAHDALLRMHKEMQSAKTLDIKTMPTKIAAHWELSAIQHLLAFWSAEPPYKPAPRTADKRALSVVHGFDQCWQHLSHGPGAQMRLMDDGEELPQPPETWTLAACGGPELDVEFASGASDWARCGEVVMVSPGDGERWVAVILSMQAQTESTTRAVLFIMSHVPQAVQLRVVIEKGEEEGFSNDSARAFGFNRARAIMLSEGGPDAPPPNFVLPPERAKPGRTFEVTDAARYLRPLRGLRRGDDYVRATFEWVDPPAA